MNRYRFDNNQVSEEKLNTQLPVTVVVSRRPVPGHEADLAAWAHGISNAASVFPGHLGAQVFEATADREDVVIVFSFASADVLAAWERSPERAEWIAKAGPLTVGPQEAHTVSGFESLFSPTARVVASPPPRWKTATIIFLALYPMSLLINWLLGNTGIGQHIASWNLFLRVLLTTALIVPYMAWVGVPFLTKRLHTWLRR